MALDFDLFRDPALMSPAECQQIILSVRSAVQNNEEVSDAQLRYAVSLIPIIRGNSAKAIAAGKPAKEKPAQISLASF